MFQLIDYDYFGFLDDDQILARKEQKAEEQAIAHKVNLWKHEMKEKKKSFCIMPLEYSNRGKLIFSYFKIPTSEEIKTQMLEKKKEVLFNNEDKGSLRCKKTI